jgi:predicted lactoylglutathione lyase
MNQRFSKNKLCNYCQDFNLHILLIKEPTFNEFTRIIRPGLPFHESIS